MSCSSKRNESLEMLNVFANTNIFKNQNIKSLLKIAY